MTLYKRESEIQQENQILNDFAQFLKDKAAIKEEADLKKAIQTLKVQERKELIAEAYDSADKNGIYKEEWKQYKSSVIEIRDKSREKHSELIEKLIMDSYLDGVVKDEVVDQLFSGYDKSGLEKALEHAKDRRGTEPRVAIDLINSILSSILRKIK